MAALCLAPAVAAQESRLFGWRGTVDDDVRIAMHAGSIQSTLVRGSPTDAREWVSRDNVLPRREGTVRVELLEGRGTVRVIQQPNASNRYTSIVQIKDGARGASRYRFATYFTPRYADRGRTDDTVFTVGGDVSLTPGTSVLRWTGNVDGDLRISLRRNSVGYYVLSGGLPRNVSASVAPEGLPPRDARVTLVSHIAPGYVAIVEQPSSANQYTAVVRVTERRLRYYDFDLIWREVGRNRR